MTFYENKNNSLKTFLILTSILILGVLVTNFDNQAFGHGCMSMMQSRDFRIEDETFSKQTSTTESSFTISGTIIGLKNQENTPVEIFVRPQNLNVPYLQFFHDLVYGTSMYDGNHADWYFKYDSDPTQISIIEGEALDFQITVFPLKEGKYHIHTFLPETEKQCRWGPGQTMIISGSSELTSGEILGLYGPATIFPISLGVTLLIGVYYYKKPKSIDNLK